MRQQIMTAIKSTATAIMTTMAGMLAVAGLSQVEAMAQEAASADGEQYEIGGVEVTGQKIEHSGDFLKVGMDLDLTGLDVRSNRAVLLTPHIVNETDSLDLPSIGIYGRQRYIFYVRNRNGMITEDEESYREKDKPDEIGYEQVLTYPEWARGSSLKLHLRWSEWGCCNNMLEENDALLYTEAIAFYPELVPFVPEGQAVKERSLSGSARVEFVVDKTDIRPTYRDNEAELGKITSSISSVSGDSDVTITRVYLKGYASPEDTYAHNTMLAKGRVKAVRDYVARLYNLADSVFVTDYEPEDWEGLREYVVASTDKLGHKQAILDLIDSDLDPDLKEWKIRFGYPKDYSYLLRNCYPALRHTYYEVDYIVRTYVDIEEIKAVFASHPGNLSLNELYLLSREYEPGSEEFSEVFETAVRLYPEDEAANLNAANAALRMFDTKKAAKYLEKAGRSGIAEYARGVCDYWESDYDAAVEHFKNAQEAGIEQAAGVLENLENVDRDKIEASRKAAILDALNVK